MAVPFRFDYYVLIVSLLFVKHMKSLEIIRDQASVPAKSMKMSQYH